MIAASATALPLLALAALLSFAVATDLKSRRIPNRLVLAGIGLALALHALAWVVGGQGLAGPNPWSPLTGLLAGGATLMPLYLLRACGAGDVKLMAMVGAFIGVPAVLAAAVYTLLAGGLLSLLFMFAGGVAAQTLANVRYMLTDWALRLQTRQGARLAPLEVTAARLPYATAIALGTAASLIWPLASFA